MLPRRPRLPSGSYEQGLGCLLTICTAGRRAVFVDAEIVDLVWTQIQRAASGNGIAIPAYCFMSDHLHMLAEPGTPAANVERFMKQAKQLTGYYYKQRTGVALWQPSWHDRVLRRADDRAAAIRYVLENPIRAGLVQSLAEYPFLGSGVVSREALLSSI